MEEEKKYKEYKEILKKYKDYIYFNTKYMSEAEYWREKYYGKI